VAEQLVVRRQDGSTRSLDLKQSISNLFFATQWRGARALSWARLGGRRAWWRCPVAVSSGGVRRPSVFILYYVAWWPGSSCPWPPNGRSRFANSVSFGGGCEGDQRSRWSIASSKGAEPLGPLTRKDVVELFGELDDIAVADIIATGATWQELAEAQTWLADDEALINAGKHLPSARGPLGRHHGCQGAGRGAGRSGKA
jgi:hypothetical protein